MMRSRFLNRQLRVLAVGVVLVASSGVISGFQAIDSGGNSAAHAERALGRRLSLQGVPNFGEVTSQLYRGGQPTVEGFKGLAERGVGIVIDLRGGGDRERAQVTKLGMQYVAIPWRCFNPRDQQFALFLRVLRDNPDKKVFVHCRLGVDRTGMMVASYRMGEQGWSASEAAKEMVVFGFSSLHRMLCPALSSYEAKFPWNFQTNPVFEGLRPSDPSSK
jgi:protein tyrosine/serine phosphatase